MYFMIKLTTHVRGREIAGMAAYLVGHTVLPVH